MVPIGELGGASASAAAEDEAFERFRRGLRERSPDPLSLREQLGPSLEKVLQKMVSFSELSRDVEERLARRGRGCEDWSRGL